MRTAVVDCGEHEGCALIVHAYDDNRPCWVSHAPAHTHVECRIGDTTGDVVDRRPGHDGKVRRIASMCHHCADTFGAAPEHRAGRDVALGMGRTRRGWRRWRYRRHARRMAI